MIYPFECGCGVYREVVRAVDESHKPEVCECGLQMQRVWTVPEVSVSFQQPYYNHGLGCYVGNKHDVREAVKRLGGEQVRDVWRRDENGAFHVDKVKVPGINVIEVGNEKVDYKPKLQEYTVPREVMAAIDG